MGRIVARKRAQDNTQTRLTGQGRGLRGGGPGEVKKACFKGKMQPPLTPGRGCYIIMDIQTPKKLELMKKTL